MKPEFSLLGMFEHCSTYAEFISLCRWEVVTFPDEFPLITSDCPVHFRCENHIALADPETVMHFPLTGKNMLVMSAAESEESRRDKLCSMIPEPYVSGFVLWHNCVYYRQAAEEEAAQLNMTTASMCHEYVYCGDAADTLLPALRAPSKNVRFHVTREGDGFRLTLEAGRQR